MAKGHVKLHRSIEEWEYAEDPYAFRVFTYLILNAAYKKTKYFGHEIRRGQWCGSARKISEDTGLHRNTVKKWLDTLKETGEIDWFVLKGKYRIFTIKKYHKYQAQKDEGDRDTSVLPLYGTPVYHPLYGTSMYHRKEVSKNNESTPLDGEVDSGEETLDDDWYIQKNKKRKK